MNMRFILEKTQQPILDVTPLIEGLRSFLKQPKTYKYQFLQRKLNTSASDGYSYMGQKDSLNQYDKDLLHSFVLSDTAPLDILPQEFHSYIRDELPKVLEIIGVLERTYFMKYGLDFLSEYYDDYICHSVSYNYYPAVTNKQRCINNIRLSLHKDGSFFTFFPYGVPSGFSYLNHDKEAISIEENKHIVVQTGYYLELLDGQTSSSEHQVDLPENMIQERFSFAVFSMPKPKTVIPIKQGEMLAEQFHQEYLKLF